MYIFVFELILVCFNVLGVVVNHFRDNHHRLKVTNRNWFKDLFGSAESTQDISIESKSPNSNITIKRSIYMWGGTGSGKTFLMDIFYSTLVQFKNSHPHWKVKVHV